MANGMTERTALRFVEKKRGKSADAVKRSFKTACKT